MKTSLRLVYHMTKAMKLCLDEIKELKDELNDTQKDFLSVYNDNLCPYNVGDLGDAFSEWADSNVSCYYSEQREYYYDHTSECMDAFREFGYELKDFDDLDDALCKAGVCGWYNSLLNELYEDGRLERLQELQDELDDLEAEEADDND